MLACQVQVIQTALSLAPVYSSVSVPKQDCTMAKYGTVMFSQNGNLKKKKFFFAKYHFFTHSFK